MRRRAIVLTTLLAAFAAHHLQARNVAEWTADLLRDVVQGYRPERGVDGKYHVLVLYRTDGGKVSDFNLRHPEVAPRQEKVADNPDGVYTQLKSYYAAEGFQSVIVTDLLPQQIIGVEQFARESRVVVISLVSAMPDRGRVPFAFDGFNQVGFARLEALAPYQLQMKTTPPRRQTVLRLELLDSDLPYQAFDQCTPMNPKDNSFSPEVICHRNAFALLESQASNTLQEGIRDLEVAVLHVFDEELDHRLYPRGWGREGYHPHVGLADYLSRFGACASVTRELALAKHSNDTVKKNIEERIGEQCKSVHNRIAGNGIPAGDAWSILRLPASASEAQLIPPMQPRPEWADIFSLR